jgi:hypothetical protein
VAVFQKRIETSEQERAESEHFALTMSLKRAVVGNYIMLAGNDADEEVVVEGVNLTYDDVDLSKVSVPAPNGSWKIEPHSRKQICWVPQPDPVSTFKILNPSFRSGEALAIQLVLQRRIRGKPKGITRKQIVTVG